MNFMVLILIGIPILTTIDKIKHQIAVLRDRLDSLGLCRQV